MSNGFIIIPQPVDKFHWTKFILKERVYKGGDGGGLGKDHKDAKKNKDDNHRDHPPQAFFPEIGKKFSNYV